MISYIVACEYINGIKSYITNVDPLLWSKDITVAKKFHSKDDMINDLRFDIETLYTMKNNYDYISNIVYMKFDEEGNYIYTKRLLK